MENIDELRLDCARKQKKGIHFIIASVVIWACVTCVHLTHMDIMTKNLLTFCFTAPLMPLAFLISKLIKVDFQNKSNPLTNLGILFSCNQILYILIAMWTMSAVPDKMLMVFAMIFGAHLMPFSWLYKSKSYMALSIIIPIASLVIGVLMEPYVLAIVMLATEILFSALLALENKRL